MRPSFQNVGYLIMGIISIYQKDLNYASKLGKFKIQNKIPGLSIHFINVIIICCRCCYNCYNCYNYISQTTISLRKCTIVHRQQIRNPSSRKILPSKHLDRCAGSCQPNCKLFSLYQCDEKIIEGQRINIFFYIKI